MRKFTPTQVAKGILTTISRGDWSLAASRLRQASEKDKIATIVNASLSKEEREIWRRYYKDE